MCITLDLPVIFATGLTYGEGLTVVGLVFDLAGIGLLTISGIFGEKPIHRLYHLITAVDRENLSDSENESFDIDLVSTTERDPDSQFSSEPQTKGDYDALKSRLLRSISGAVFIIIGLTLQLAGTVFC
jgi:hypothetical protein